MSTFVNTVDVVGDEALTNSILDRSITELDDNMVLNLCDDALRGCKSLTRLRMMSVTEIGEYACGYCEALKKIDFPLATEVGASAFANCFALEKVAFPAVTKLTSSYTFTNCTALKLVDLGAVTQLGGSAFYGCKALETLILRTESVCGVSSISNVFYNTPISKGTGYIYVPASMVDSYKAASGWSTYANQIRAIEDYPEICDLYSWEAVAKTIENGTYKDVYKIGDTVPVDLGSEGIINMQITHFDTATLADNSGTAAITWIAKELLNTNHRMNPSLVTGTEGTGTYGGWEKCEMRTYLKESILPLIPENVRGIIQPVLRMWDGYNGSTRETGYSQDELWIPARGIDITSEAFATSADLIKKKADGTTVSHWWLRGAWNSTNFYCANNSTGNTDSGNKASNSYGVCLGFCTGVTPAADYVPFCSDGTTWTGEEVTTAISTTYFDGSAAEYRRSDVKYSSTPSVTVGEDTIVRLTINGVEYVCPCGYTSGAKAMYFFTTDECPASLGGGCDFSNDAWYLVFHTAGTYTVKVEVL